MLQRLRISTKLVGVIAFTVVTASLAIGVFVFRGAEQALHSQTLSHLEAERGSRGRMVTAYFQRLRDQMRISSRQLVTEIVLRDMRATRPGSAEHARLRALFHPYARGLVEAFKHPDILLVDPNGIVQYSYSGLLDASTNLRTGPLAGSGAGQAFARAVDATAGDVAFIDYQPFTPAGNAAAGFTATPVFDADGTTRLGVLIIRVAPDEISAIMTDAAGFGASGETYLVGPDLLMRTNSRFAASDTVLRQTIRSDAGRRGLAGETGAIEQIDYRGARVLAAFAPIDILGARWAIVAKIDIAEALAPARLFEVRLLALILVVGFVAALVLWETLRRIVLIPTAALAAGASRVAARNYSKPVALTSRDELGDLGRAFDGMMAAVGAQVEALKESEERLAAAASGANLGLWDVDPKTGTVLVNALFESQLGYRPLDLRETDTLSCSSRRAGRVDRVDSSGRPPASDRVDCAVSCRPGRHLPRRAPGPSAGRHIHMDSFGRQRPGA